MSILTLEAIELPDENTKFVLREVLKEQRFKNYELFISSASAKGDNYVGALYRISVKGTKENGDLEDLNLILKVPPNSEILRQNFPVASLYMREVAAYNLLFPAFSKLERKHFTSKSFKFNYIKCYRAMGEHMKELLLLEDMCASGFVMHDRRKSLDVKHLKLALESLANFHSLSFYMKKVNPKMFEEMSSNLFSGIDFKKEHTPILDMSRDRALGVITDPANIQRVKEVCNDMFEGFLKCVDPELVAPYNVFCHGDCWINNMLFKYEDGEPVEVRLLDWQMVRNSSPITDLAYLIFNSTDEDLRRRHFNTLMDFYHNCLKSKLASMGVEVEDCYPKKIFKDNIKTQFVFGLFSAIMALPAMLGEAGDVMDMEVILSKETLESSDIAFNNQKTQDRYAARMDGVVRDMIHFGFI